jgi:hypothetical protein
MTEPSSPESPDYRPHITEFDENVVNIPNNSSNNVITVPETHNKGTISSENPNNSPNIVITVPETPNNSQLLTVPETVDPEKLAPECIPKKNQGDLLVRRVKYQGNHVQNGSKKHHHSSR